MRRILALDLGTKTGWALESTGGEGADFIMSGTEVLMSPEGIAKQKKDGLDRCCDLRCHALLRLIEHHDPTHIFFEDVQFLSTQFQAQLWSSLRAMVLIQYPSTEVTAVPVGTLKKFATGNGAAKKDAMAAALVKKNPGRYEFRKSKRGRAYLADTVRDVEVDDNEVDAIHLLNYAIEKLK